MSTLSAPGLAKQPSFGQAFSSMYGQPAGMFGSSQSTGVQLGGQPGQGLFNTQSSTGIGFTGLSTSTNPLGASNIPQVPGQLTSSPSFGTLQQSTQAQAGSMFGQPTAQPQQAPLATSNNPAILVSHTAPLGLNTSAPSTNPPNSQSQPNSQPQQPTNTLDQNIK